MYIPNDDTQNSPFCRLQLVVKNLDTQIDESTDKNLLKFPKVAEPMKKEIRNRYYKTLGTSVIKSPLSPPSLKVVVHGSLQFKWLTPVQLFYILVLHSLSNSQHERTQLGKFILIRITS